MVSPSGSPVAEKVTFGLEVGCVEVIFPNETVGIMESLITSRGGIFRIRFSDAICLYLSVAVIEILKVPVSSGVPLNVLLFGSNEIPLGKPLTSTVALLVTVNDLLKILLSIAIPSSGTERLRAGVFVVLLPPPD